MRFEMWELPCRKRILIVLQHPQNFSSVFKYFFNDNDAQKLVPYMKEYEWYHILSQGLENKKVWV